MRIFQPLRSVRIFQPLRSVRIFQPLRSVRIFRPLRSMPTALLWGGMSLSALGDQLYAVALTWIAVGVLGAYAGYLSALNAAALLLGVLGLGRWADGWNQRHSMIAADLARAAILLVVVATWLAHGGPAAAPLIAAVIVLALGQAVFQPALQSTLPGVVGDLQLLPAANGLLDTTERTARLLGPGLVGLLAGLFPIVHFLTLDALSFIASALALLMIGRLTPGLTTPRRTTREPIPQALRRGVRAMHSHPLLGFALRTTGPLNGAWYAVFYLGLPLLIEQHRITGPGGSGLGAYGLVISAYGCTNLASTLVFGSRTLPTRPQFQMFGGNIVVGTGMALIGVAAALPHDWLLPAFAAAAALGAVGGPMSDIPKAVLRQTRLPPGDVAAAMRAYIAYQSAGVLVAMLVAPTVFTLAGTAPVVVACGGVMVALGALGIVRHAAWTETAPAPSPAQSPA